MANYHPLKDSYYIIHHFLMLLRRVSRVQWRRLLISTHICSLTTGCGKNGAVYLLYMALIFGLDKEYLQRFEIECVLLSC